MEHEKHRTCENCGGPIEPGVVYKDKWDCPACNAAIWGRFRKCLLMAVFGGGVTAFAFFYWEYPGNMSLSYFIGVWVVTTLILLFLLLTPGGWVNGGGWGNGDGGNGGG